MTDRKRAARIVRTGALAVLLCTMGCGVRATLWSYQAESPSGKWIALAQTDNTDTIGNVEYTTVRVKELGSWRPPKKLVVFDGGVDEKEDFQMVWDGAKHLSIVVSGYSPDPVPYRALDQTPISFSVRYVKKPYPTSR